VLEPRHAVSPLRTPLTESEFVEAEVEQIDLENQRVHVRAASDESFDIEYDQLVLALGGVTNRTLVAGSDHTRTFKTLGDAIQLRNHVIAAFERATVEKDAARKRAHLTFVIVGGGLVAVELAGELAEFVRNLARLYSHIRPDEIRLEMLESGPRIAAEFADSQSEYARCRLEKRGVRVRLNVRVERIDGDKVHLPGGEEIEARTILLAVGVSPSPLIASLPLEKDKKGRAVVEATLRVRGRNNVWALGDCASIPDPSGKPYPQLAQHALREAKCVAGNISAVVRGGVELQPFIYQTKGMLAALGHFDGMGQVFGIRIRGFIAWWVWRTYYLFQMPRWNRRVRIMIDWTISLFFHNDIVELDLAPEDGAKK